MPPIVKWIKIAEYAFNIFALLVMTTIGILYILKKKGINVFARKKKEIDLSDAEEKSNEEFMNHVINQVENNMAICDDGKYFVAAVKIHGFNYNKGTKQERLLIQEGMLELLSIMDFSTQMYDQCAEIDVEPNINLLKTCKENIQKKISRTKEEIIYIKKALSNDELPTEEKEGLKKQLQDKEFFLNCKIWQLHHNEEQIAYSKAISTQDDVPDRGSYIIFSFEYDPGAFTVERTPQEVYKMAYNDLYTKANSICKVFERRKLRAERIKNDKLEEVLYRHFNPIHADLYKYKQLIESNIDSFAIYSDSFKELQKEIMEEEKLRKELDEKYSVQEVDEIDAKVV